MPYKRDGRTIYKLQNGKWVVVKVHDSVEEAKKHLAALNINVMKKGKK